MRFVADVHLHSHYSRATSRDLDPERVHKWSALKGVDVVGTADFTHPEWLAEIKEKLEPVEEGLYRLRRPWREPIEAELPRSCGGEVRFMLSVEISSIYKKNDRTRKVHNVVILPDFDSVDDLNRRLGAIGNLKSDGRPILGLDSRDLLEICLEVCPDVLFIPAHIWTPHFAALGASSGFDSLEECYEDLLPHIHAVETGLSSDPADERQAVRPRSLQYRVELRRALAAQAGARSDLLRHRPVLPGHSRRTQKRRSEPLCGHHRVLPGGRQVPLRRAPQMRRALEAKSNPWRPVACAPNAVAK